MLLSISKMLSLCSSSLSVSAVDTTSTVQTEGTGQVSTLFEDELNEKLADLSNDFGITSVEVNNNKAVVKYHATRDCTVLIGIYEDDGTKGTHMLSFEKGELKATEVETTITLNNLPNYFYLKAYLIDSETYKPLSKVYDTPNYTKNMKEFFERTVDDFPEERVWNLDDSKTNNFMVVAENTKVLNSRLEIDSADITYTVNTISIKNNADADKNIASLKSGDPFMLFCETGVLHGIISTITFSEDGKKAEITYSEAQTGDLFEHIRIDTSDIVKSEVATYSPRRIIDYAPPEIKPEVTPFSVGASFNVSNEDSDNDNDKEGVNISGNVEATFGVAVEGEVKIYYSSEEKDEVDYLEINCTPKITVSAEGEGSITLNKTWFDKRIELVNVPVPPLGIPTIPIVTARLSLSSSASVTVSGKAEVTFVVPGELTITADMHSDKPLTHRFEKVEPTANAEAAITFAGTVALTAKVCVCDIEIAALASAGVKLEIKEEIKFYKDLSNDPNSPEHGYVKHSCGALECISGTNSISFTATIFFESPILKLMPETDFGELGSENEIDKVTLDLGEGKISYELINKELLPENMRDFYIRTNPFSFNYGKCKNKSYLTFFNIRDTYNNIPVTGATVKYGKEVFVNEENGVVSFFIPCGTSAKITVEHEDYLPCTYTTNVITDYKTYEDIDITHKKAITKITPIPVETKSPVIYVHGDDLRFTSLKIEYADGTSKSIPFFVDGRINK